MKSRARGCACGKTEAVTDREGYFRVELEGSFEPGWNEVQLELLHPAPRKPRRTFSCPRRTPGSG